MFKIRRANERGHANHGWLDTWHTFSFSSYQDPRHMQFRCLRVMNEDRVAPGQGFGEHSHSDMEIVTYVLSGALEHKDSMGNGEILRPGEFQRMTAGTGIRHSEFNASDSEPAHFYQIWLFPERKGIEPSYEQKAFSLDNHMNQLRLVASRNADEGSLTVHADVKIYLSRLSQGGQLNYDIAPERHAWIQVIRGHVQVNSLELKTSDGLAVSEEPLLSISAHEESELMLFDLP